MLPIKRNIFNVTIITGKSGKESAELFPLQKDMQIKNLVASDPRIRTPGSPIYDLVKDALSRAKDALSRAKINSKKLEEEILKNLKVPYLPIDDTSYERLIAKITNQYITPYITNQYITPYISDEINAEEKSRADIIAQEDKARLEIPTRVYTQMRNELEKNEISARKVVDEERKNEEIAFLKQLTEERFVFHKNKGTLSKEIEKTGNLYLDVLIGKLVEKFNSRDRTETILIFFKKHESSVNSVQAEAYAIFLKCNDVSKEEALAAAHQKCKNIHDYSDIEKAINKMYG